MGGHFAETFFTIPDQGKRQKPAARIALVLSTAIESGLSGPGRLHDLMVSCEAFTPGEIGARVEGLMIRYGFAASPFGTLIIGTTARGICHLRFVELNLAEAEEAILRTEWPHAEFDRDDTAAQRLVAHLLDPFNGPKPLNLLLHGTNSKLRCGKLKF